jgi:antitoxin VapB
VKIAAKCFRFSDEKISRIFILSGCGSAPCWTAKQCEVLVYTFDRYFMEGRMATGASTSQKPTDAKLFWSGRSQAVRLPKAFRFEGDRVRVSRMGAGILLEPVPKIRKETAEQLFARMDAMGADPIFPEGRKQNLAPIREYFK